MRSNPTTWFRRKLQDYPRRRMALGDGQPAIAAWAGIQRWQGEAGADLAPIGPMQALPRQLRRSCGEEKIFLREAAGVVRHQA
jgi:hypothetical protein